MGEKRKEKGNEERRGTGGHERGESAHQVRLL
jgi:hypothetical protein